MAANAALWKLHLLCRRSHIPERFDADVHGKGRALAGVTSVDSAPSHDASTRLVFSTPYAPAVVAAVAAKHSASTRRSTPTTAQGGSGKCGSLTSRQYARWRRQPLPSSTP
jgi:hypothetical protein